MHWYLLYTTNKQFFSCSFCIVKGNNSYSIYVNKNSEVINNLLIYIYILFVDNNTHVQKNHNYMRKI